MTSVPTVVTVPELLPQFPLLQQCITTVASVIIVVTMCSNSGLGSHCFKNELGSYGLPNSQGKRDRHAGPIRCSSLRLEREKTPKSVLEIAD